MESEILIILFLLVISTVSQQDCNDGKYSEIALVLDRSQSISNDNWKLVKTFAKKLMTTISISPNGNRAGIVTFADTAKKEIYCNQHASVSSINNAIDTLHQTGEFTNIQDGLEKGQEILLQSGCDERSSIRNRIILLMTDGKANRGNDMNGPTEPAKQIRSTGTLIFAVGVGETDYSELTGITGDGSRVVHGINFTTLLSYDVIANLTTAICTSPSPTTTIVTTTTTTVVPTTSTTNIPPTPDLDSGLVCNCTLVQEDYTCIKWTRYEIIRNFNGSCYTDKLKIAIKFISEKYEKVCENIKALESCKKTWTRNIIENTYPPEITFPKYDECAINIACKLKRTKDGLSNKKKLLEQELSMEMDGYGYEYVGDDIQGYMASIKKFMTGLTNSDGMW